MEEAASPLRFKDRSFSAADQQLIQEVVSSCSGLSRQELAKTVCELLDWRRPNGRLKTWEGKQLLERLQDVGQVQLPALRQTKPVGAQTSVPRTAQGEIQEPLVGTLSQVAPVVLRRVSEASDRRLWRELVGRYHYLGYRVPFGAQLRYFIEVTRPEVQVVGCVQLSSPAWKMAVRDRWIGWGESRRKANLQRIVNQSRFLLLPWVGIRHLASHVLSRMVKVMAKDWHQLYGVRPLLVETLVETGRYRGTCYRAANWLYLGQTSGRGRMDSKHRRQGACRKGVYVYPLLGQAQQRLRGQL
jgi:hypothetical protein